MSFVNTQYFTLAIVSIIAIAFLLNRLNVHFFKWVKSYWFFERTWSSRLASLFYILSLFLFMISLLDLRGPEKKVRANLPDQRTIIVLDTSASMLAEDVRPSRFVKSLQLARHFVKNAAGHQVSIVLFSDTQKRLMPFTDDIDLLDSRLAALEKTNAVSGGSNISQAIEEAIQYFEFDSSNDEKSTTGNMLVFTDAEESEGEFTVHIPTNVNLAIVGVGTAKGGNIPLRWDDGSFRGYKTFKGEPVLTKLDEAYIKKMGNKVRNFKYWIANSYSLPTDEIVSFFRATYVKSQNVGDMRVRPVYSHFILIPAIILYCLSVLLGRFAQFKVAQNLVVLLCFFSVGIQGLRAEEEKTKPLNPEIQKDLEIIKEGKADRKYVLKVAEKMLKDKETEKAVELYSEYSRNNDDEEVRFNYATSLLKSNRTAEALPLIQNLMKNSKNEDLKNKLRNNVLLGLDPNKQKEQQQKQQKEEQNKQDKKENKENQENKKDKENKDNKSENKDKKENGKEGKDDKGKSEKEEKSEGKSGGQQKKRPDAKEKLGEEKENKKEDGKEKNKDKDKNKGQQQEEQKQEEQKQGPSTIEEKEKEIEQKRRMVKTPAMIKQILSDDRELQKKMMDTSTSERGKPNQKRDW